MLLVCSIRSGFHCESLLKHSACLLSSLSCLFAKSQKVYRGGEIISYLSVQYFVNQQNNRIDPLAVNKENLPACLIDDEHTPKLLW